MPRTLAIAGTVEPRRPLRDGPNIGAETGVFRAEWAGPAKGADWHDGFSGRGRGRKAMRKGLAGLSGKLSGQAGSVDAPMPACRFVEGILPADAARPRLSWMSCAARRCKGRRIQRLANTTKPPLRCGGLIAYSVRIFGGSSKGNRTPDFALRGRRLNRLTMEPNGWGTRIRT